MKINFFNSFLYLLLFSATGCNQVGLFERSIPIPLQAWKYTNKLSYDFNITDTTSYYNLSVVLRHTDAYKYNNIWLKLGSLSPGDTMHFQNINLTLASDAKGWEGFGVDDIFEVRKNITPGPIAFKKPGTYHFELSHIMREDPLLHILNAGIRVEKVEK